MENILIFLILTIVVFIIFKQFTNMKKNTKSKVLKKSEIIDDYKKQIDTLNLRFKDNPDELKVQKVSLLKSINIELSQNIFFDADELKQTMQELTSYSFR